MKLLIILIAICALVDRNSGEETPPGQALYQALPENERPDFLIFSLGYGYSQKSTILHRNTGADFRFPDALGIREELLQKFQNLTYPEDFTSKLYVLTRGIYNLDVVQMRTLILKRTVCLANGNCIDINDVGSLCCPF